MSKSITPATPKPEGFRFPRTARIRSSREFALVRSQGRSAQGRLMRMSVAQAPESGPAKFGIITSRRVGGAVQRNRVRRRLREICRLHRPQTAPDFLVVISARSQAAGADLDELREEWLLLARRLSIYPRSP